MKSSARSIFIWFQFIFLFVSFIRAQVSNQELSPDFFVHNRNKVCDILLQNGQCAVFFSGGMHSFDHENNFPATYYSRAPFFFLTGLNIPDAVIVLFKEGKTFPEGKFRSILFIPGDDTFYSLYGTNQKTESPGLLVKNSDDWVVFCENVLASDSVSKVYTHSFIPGSYKRTTGVTHDMLCAQLFNALVPGYPVSSSSIRFYSLIQQFDSTTAEKIYSEVAAFNKYYSDEIYDPLLKAFVNAFPDHRKIESIKEVIGQFKIDLTQAELKVNELRSVKNNSELAFLRKSAEILSESFGELTNGSMAGKMQYQIEAEIKKTAISKGGKAASPLIIVSGTGCIHPFDPSNDEMITANDLVMADWGIRYKGYHSRMTRTVPVAGKFTPEQKKIYSLLENAYLSCIGQLKPGAIAAGIVLTEKDKLIKALAASGIFSSGARTDILTVILNITGIGLEQTEAVPGGKIIAGNVFLVEGGIIIPSSAQVKKEYRETGIFFRDVVELNPEGNKILTGSFPIKATEIEIAMGNK